MNKKRNQTNETNQTNQINQKALLKKVFGLKKRYETKNAKGKSKTTPP